KEYTSLDLIANRARFGGRGAYRVYQIQRPTISISTTVIAFDGSTVSAPASPGLASEHSPGLSKSARSQLLCSNSVSSLAHRTVCRSGQDSRSFSYDDGRLRRRIDSLTRRLARATPRWPEV